MRGIARWLIMGAFLAACTGEPAAEPRVAGPAGGDPPPAASDRGGPEGAAAVSEPATADEAPAAPADAPLRKVVLRLIDGLANATIEPPIAGRIPAGCARLKESAPNPYSTLPPALRQNHWRVSLHGGGPGQVEMRESYLLQLPRRLRYALRTPAAARLDFAYRPYPCAGPLSSLALEVEVRAAERTLFATRVELPVDIPLDVAPFRSVRVPLDVPADIDVTLELRFVPQPERPTDDGPVLVWAEPLVTGRVAPQNPAEDRNVLILVIDAARGDALGPGRRIASVTPQLDALMRRGTAFSKAFAVGNQTRPSTLGLLQSQVPSLGRFQSMWWTLKPPFKQRYYAADPPLLTRRLAAAGWRTFTFGHNHFLWPAYPIGLDHGFDGVIDVRVATDDTPRLTELTEAYLRAHQDERWLLLVNLVAPHTPYLPPQPYLERVNKQFPEGDPEGIKRNYLGELAYTDDYVGRIVEALERLGLSERTLVIVTADHGEVMGPRHQCESERFKMICHYSHGLTLYDEEIHVPLAFVLPGTVQAGHVVEAVTSHLNVAPTVLDLLGQPADPRHLGRSLRPQLSGELGIDEPIYVEGRAAAAYRHGGRKLIVHHRMDDAWTDARTGGTQARPLEQLFDLEEDPGETTNRLLYRGTSAAELRAEMERHRAALHERLAAAGGPAAGALADAGSPETAVEPSADPGLPAGEPATAAAPAPAAIAPAAAPAAAPAGPGAGPAAPAGVAAAAPPRPLAGPAAPDGSAAENTLWLQPGRAPRELRGTVRTAAGLLTCCHTTGRARCTNRGPTSIDVELAAGDRAASVAFHSLPWGAPLSLELRLDGQPFDPAHLRLGPYGLALLAAGQGLDDPARLALAAGRHGPLLPPRGESGVYLWRDLAAAPAGTAAAGALPAGPEAGAVPSGDAAMDEEMHKVLKELGYTK